MNEVLDLKRMKKCGIDAKHSIQSEGNENQKTNKNLNKIFIHFRKTETKL